MKNILIFCKGYLDKAVPIISLAQTFYAGGNKVEIICGNISSEIKHRLEETGIKIYSFGISESNHTGFFIKIFQKLFSWIKFRKKAKTVLKNRNPDYIYIATGDTAIAMRGMYQNYKYFLHLRELYDTNPSYMKLIKKPAQNAYKVVVPEENRAFLYYNFLKLKSVPIVVPNKPFSHPAKNKMNINFLDQKLKNQIKQKKNIIYQGPLHIERDLTNLIEISANLNNYNIILMGKDYGMLSIYKKINPNLIYIPFITPPFHLNVTSWADIGIITYDFKSLNTIYCAPNKIWEYTGFGIPILGNINPGIKYLNDLYKIGVSVDFKEKDRITDAIRIIEKNYFEIRNNCNNFYKNQNNDFINDFF